MGARRIGRMSVFPAQAGTQQRPRRLSVIPAQAGTQKGSNLTVFVGIPENLPGDCRIAIQLEFIQQPGVVLRAIDIP